MIERRPGHEGAPVPIDVSSHLLDGWDLVISIGQVVPHEVAGMANFTKNLMVGLGGDAMIGRSHLLGAQVGIESVIGESDNPVRRFIDTAFDQCLADRIDVLWLLTVMESTNDGVVQRGLFAGIGRSIESGGAAFRAAAELAADCAITTVDQPFERVVCRMDPAEFHTTWLANKAIYRCRRAMATGGELVILAPGVAGFGEDPEIDQLIRRHGYRGTRPTLDALAGDPRAAGQSRCGGPPHPGQLRGPIPRGVLHRPGRGRVDAGRSRGGRLRLASAGRRSWLTSAWTRARWRATTPTSTAAPFHYLDHPALGLWTVRRGAGSDVVVAVGGRG